MKKLINEKLVCY